MTTKLKILETGMRLWRVDPSYVTTRRIENELGMSHGTTQYHFGTLHQLKDAIAYHAIKQGESRVISQLISMGHPAANSLTDNERLEHMKIAAEAVRV